MDFLHHSPYLGHNILIQFLVNKSGVCYKSIKSFSAGKICKYDFQHCSSYLRSFHHPTTTKFRSSTNKFSRASTVNSQIPVRSSLSYRHVFIDAMIAGTSAQSTCFQTHSYSFSCKKSRRLEKRGSR